MGGLTTLPHVAISIDGRTLDDPSVACLEDARVARSLSLPAQCALRFHLGLGGHPTIRRIEPGSTLELRVGTHRIFTGRVAAVEIQLGADAATRVFVRAYDALHDLRRRQLRSGRGPATVADLIREVTGGHVTGDPGPAHLVVSGHDEDALTTIVRLAARVGRYLVVDDARIRIVTLDGYGAPVVLRHGVDVHELAIDANADQAVHTVAGSAWAPAQGERMEASASVGGCLSGDWGFEQQWSGQPASTQTELEAIVEGDADRADARTVVVRGVAEGSPALVPSRRVVVQGVPGFSGHIATITESTHTIDERGYRVAFSTEPPQRPRDDRPSRLTFGIVADVADPEKRARVKVRLPDLDDATTDWAPVLMQGVGLGTGLVALPDLGASVIVALGRGDPSDCVVLGAFFGPTRSDDAGVVGGRVKRYQVRLPSGLQLTLDEDDERIRLEHPNGGLVSLGADGVSIVATTPLRIDASGQPVEIKAKTVDFVEAG